MTTDAGLRTAEAEETLRVMAHIRDLNRVVAEAALQVRADALPGDPARLGLQRLQSLPFLLADFRFTDELFWQTCVLEEPGTANGSRHADAQIQLARHLLSVAWHSGRAGAGPRLLLGISKEVGELITLLRFSQLDTIASTYAAQVQRRWADVPDFWAQLLRSAQADNERRWSRFQVHALRLLGRERH